MHGAFKAMAMNDMISFVNGEINGRGWTVSELARRAEMSWAAVGDVLNGKTKPGLRWYIGVARALGVSVDHLLRLAGELPGNVMPADELNEEEAEMVALYRSLPPGPPREYALKMISGWAKEWEG
jgi:transcriptional regulator with XRE-family HTH domain